MVPLHETRAPNDYRQSGTVSRSVGETGAGAEPSDTELLREQVALLTEKVAALSTSSCPRSDVSNGRAAASPADDRDVSVVIGWGTYFVNAPIAVECRWKLGVVSRAASLDTLPGIVIRETRTGRL